MMNSYRGSRHNAGPRSSGRAPTWQYYERMDMIVGDNPAIATPRMSFFRCPPLPTSRNLALTEWRTLIAVSTTKKQCCSDACTAMTCVFVLDPTLFDISAAYDPSMQADYVQVSEAA